MHRPDRYGMLPLLTATLVLLLSASTVTAHPMERMDYWQTNYTELLPTDDPRAARAHVIFTRVLQVAGRRPGIVPRIFIAREDPLGIALPIAIPDGGIILSKRVLDLCYRDPARGDDRLAFVLAHEIAHLLKDDFWHMKFFQALEASKAKVRQPNKDLDEIRRVVQSTDQVLAQELQADEHGIVYASMAGFHAHAIVTEDGTGNFFADWVRALDLHSLSGSPTSHPNPAQRVEVVTTRLRQILEKVDVFNLGLRFYQTGQYARAIMAFRNFVQFFPSREVYHNLAASHHQRALQYHRLWKPDTATIPFQLSLAIDPVTRASQFPLRGPDTPNKTPAELFTEHLDKAIESYNMALSLDPAYTLSYNNLGCALLLKGEVFKAIGTFQDALKVGPEGPETLNNLGVAFLYAENPPKAMEYLRQAHVLAPTYDAPLFNLGKIAADAGQMAEAQRYWGTYVHLAAARPWIETIHHTLGGALPPAPAPPQPGTEHLMGVRVGYFEQELPKNLGSPTVTRLALEQEPFTLALYPNGMMTLAQEQEVLMLGTQAHYRGTSVRGIAIGSPGTDLLARYGHPSQILHMAQGESWVYQPHGIAFQLRDSRVISWLVF